MQLMSPELTLVFSYQDDITGVPHVRRLDNIAVYFNFQLVTLVMKYFTLTPNSPSILKLS